MRIKVLVIIAVLILSALFGLFIAAHPANGMTTFKSKSKTLKA